MSGGAPSSRVRPSTTYEALAFHALAHLPLTLPRSLRDERYLAWAAASLPSAACTPLADDALAVSGRIEADGAADAVQWLPLLHSDVGQLLATGRLELPSPDVAPHCDATALAALRARHGDGVEWLRADLLLMAPAFARAHEDAPPIRAEHVAEVAALLSSLPDEDVPRSVVLEHALGARGRAFPQVVFVGAPAPWNGLDARTPAVLALHEHAVRRTQGTFEEREWSALVRVARLLAANEPLRRAHAEWLAEASLDALVEAARARGTITRAEAERVLRATDRSLAIATVSG